MEALPVFPKLRLEQVWPNSGNLPKVLPVWFRGSKLLKSCYWKARDWDKSRFHLIPKVSSKLQYFIANSLHSIKLSCFIGLMKAVNNDKDVLDGSKLRWILGCPAVGVWHGKSPSAKFCRNLLCPWCWLRRHDLLYRSVVHTEGEQVKAGGRRARSLGVGLRLHCISFRASGDGFFDSPVHFNELRRQASLEIAPFAKTRSMLRVNYPMADMKGATVAYISDVPFAGMITGTTAFPSIPGGRLGVHVTDKPLLFSRLLASRMQWAPEMLFDLKAAGKAIEVFRGKNLFNIYGGADGTMSEV